MRIVAGHYYRYKGVVYRADLCQFCNLKRVEKYKTCLLELRGSLTKVPSEDGHVPMIADCLVHCHGFYPEVQEATLGEYVAQLMERRL